MGLDNRDYLRDESFRYSSGSSGFSAGSHAPMCRRLLIITIAVYLLQIFSVRDWTKEELTARRELLISAQRQVTELMGPAETNDLIIPLEAVPLSPAALGLPEKTSVVQNWLQLETPKIFRGQIWRLLTCAFCHDRDQIFHILFNMLFFWWFGPRLESIYGSKEFLFFYLTGATAASLCYIGLDIVSGDPTPMIGASGAVMAVTMLYAMHFPTQVIYVFFILPVEIRWMVLIYALLDLHPVLLSLSGQTVLNDNVAHAAHLGGLAFGYVYGKRQLRLFPAWARLQTWWKARRQGLKVVRGGASGPSAKSRQLADEMDAILEKISRHGEASLTRAERRTLEKASRELRDRRG
ncbi:MAG: rhomboid family intramembrane serine protease [Fuerstiella sp.]